MNINIAIDGFSSCGKSTLAKALSKRIGYSYIDTGAMYRAVTLYFINQNVSLEIEKEIVEALAKIDIQFQLINGKNTTFLNGTDVEEQIRSPKVASKVSPVATIGYVRTKLVDLQKKMGLQKKVVMDGRDIGTVVFPDAELKLFITADVETRTKRRYNEMISKGVDVDFNQVMQNLKQRDHIDSTREISPLKMAEDAILIDNSDLTQIEQLELAINYFKKTQKQVSA